MGEISNIDSIVELTLREARSREGPNSIQKILEVHSDVFGELVKIFDNTKRQDTEKKAADQQADWAKGM